jgi:hypothetical protein
MDGSIYGLPPGDEDRMDFVICSYGRDGKKEDWAYDVNNKKAGLFKGDDPDKDIVYYNGEFIRAPESVKIGR